MKRFVFLLFSIILSMHLISCNEREYNITVVYGDGESFTLRGNDSSDLPSAEPREGYIFGGWYFDAEFTDIIGVCAFDGDVDVYAKWIPAADARITVLFDYGDGRSDLTYTDGSVLEPKAPSREGFAFCGWYLQGEDAPFDFSSTVNTYTVIEARWERIDSSTKRSVTLMYGNSEEDGQVLVGYGTRLARPASPERAGYSFLGWYADPSLDRLYDFNDVVTEDICLYAGWIPDGTGFINRITEDILKATVRISVTRSNRSYFGTVIDSYSSLGSGVIFKQSDSNYYILTNSHVVKADPQYQYTEYSVQDAYGTAYGAALIAEDAEYDLAVLRINKIKELGTVELATDDAQKGETVAAVGAPGGLINSVTLGELNGYKQLDSLSGADAPDFEVGCHTAPTDHGSSGGAVYDVSLRLVGIAFAVAYNDEGDFAQSYFVPITRVKEFLLGVSQA